MCPTRACGRSSSTASTIPSPARRTGTTVTSASSASPCGRLERRLDARERHRQLPRRFGRHDQTEPVRQPAEPARASSDRAATISASCATGCWTRCTGTLRTIHVSGRILAGCEAVRLGSSGAGSSASWPFWLVMSSAARSGARAARALGRHRRDDGRAAAGDSGRRRRGRRPTASSPSGPRRRSRPVRRAPADRRRRADRRSPASSTRTRMRRWCSFAGWPTTSR